MEKKICAVMLNGMAIRKHREFVKFQGYVVGIGNGNDSTPVAKDTLMLMAMSINDSWKMPIVYFPLRGMTYQG